ncbi:MAG: UDP-N-acetylmuramoyl-tripeptide--D-alanyl-D-alanine ligase [Clostridia bacterium]|nr:UDP-N-acetylmuramoyl-tripeptide--D-alanyl-D-alanine ligase [Clostridia bacterium]
MFIATVGEICNAVKGCLVEGIESTKVTGVSTDSRNIKPGMLFIALKGERFDGHDFIADALKSGVVAVIAEYFPDNVKKTIEGNQSLIKVKDTLFALQNLATYHRKKILQGPLVAVTGSSGKTSTKNLVASVLSTNFKVLKTTGNHNNEIGLPLTLLNLTPEHQVAVVEMAMRGPGQIAALAEIAEPNVGVITNIGTSHLELLGSINNIASAKGELLTSLPPEGVAILNGDDQWCRRLANKCGCRVLYYGVKNPADVSAKDIKYLDWEGTEFKVVFPDEEEVKIKIPVLGLHNVYNSLAALTVGYHLGLKPKNMIKGFTEWPVEGMRQELKVGPKGSMVFNDAYNANPESMKAALKVLETLPGRKIAVLGDMRELGHEAVNLHKELGRVVAKAGIYRLITVGKLAKKIATGAMEAGMSPKQIFICFAHREAAKYLKDLGKGDIVLFKGSRLIGMEKVLKAWEEMFNG